MVRVYVCNLYVWLLLRVSALSLLSPSRLSSFAIQSRVISNAGVGDVNRDKTRNAIACVRTKRRDEQTNKSRFARVFFFFFLKFAQIKC